jgi:hypothetical protein
MRTLNFRDYVLHPISYRIGLDPDAGNFDDGEARAIGTYINSYVRRLWLATDWPEWATITQSANVSNNLIPYSVLTTGPTFGAPNYNIARVLAVSLLDPVVNNLPLEIPFTELDRGIQVGLDHGTAVYVKYLPPPPIFTAKVWNAGFIYQKGDVVYSPVSGECYLSQKFANVNHDPVQAILDMPIGSEEIQQFVPGSPGFGAQSKITNLTTMRADGLVITDPPPENSTFNVTVKDATGATLATASETAGVATPLINIITNLANTLIADPDLATFTITVDAGALEIVLEDASDFKVLGSFAPAGSILVTSQYGLVTTQTQSYIAALAAVDNTPQRVKITLTSADVLPEWTYRFSFIDTTGLSHIAEYTMMVGDGPASVLGGIIAAIQAGGASDMFLAQLQVTLDPSTASMIVETPFTGGVHMDRFIEPPPDPEPPPVPKPPPVFAPWWTKVLFPDELVDPIVRGASVDILKEWGQFQPALAEESQLPDEVSLKTQVVPNQQYRSMEGRNRRLSRYTMK